MVSERDRNNPPAEAEARYYYATLEEPAMAA
jgi:hypothetical protein